MNSQTPDRRRSGSAARSRPDTVRRNASAGSDPRASRPRQPGPASFDNRAQNAPNRNAAPSSGSRPGWVPAQNGSPAPSRKVPGNQIPEDPRQRQGGRGQAPLNANAPAPGRQNGRNPGAQVPRQRAGQAPGRNGPTVPRQNPAQDPRYRVRQNPAPQYGNRQAPPPYGNAGYGYPQRQRTPDPRSRYARERMENDVKARRKAEKRASRRRGLRTVGRFAVYVLCAVLLLSLIAGGGLLIALFAKPDAPLDSGTISFYYGGTKVRTADAADCVEGEELYVCFNDLSEYLGMKESGSAEEMKFILRTNDDALTSSAGDGTEESVIFYTDEHRVVINGQTELLDIPNTLIGEEIWISTEFLTEWMDNLSVVYKPGRREVKVSRIIDEENSDPANKVTVYLPISFRLKKNEPTQSIEEDPGVGFLSESLREATAYELNFQTDLSEYEAYMNPQGEMRDAFLILVNADHPLTASDVPTDLADVIYTSTARNTQQLREYPMLALEALFKEMHHYGYYDMAVYSGYRSYDYQANVFEQYVQNEMASNPALSREEAEAMVLTYSTRPGTSEHQTGLAVDMDTMGSFTTDFAWTSEYYWLQENAWKFGFILRFPSDKTQVTSITFEPWHYRYVGRYHAKIIHDNGLCLEEYIARISN